MTPAERRLWQQLRANRLSGWHFRRQQILAGLIVDFYCHKAGLVIEIDGPIHERQEMEDEERTRILKEMGLRVVRFNNRQVMNHMERVLDAILDALESGAAGDGEV
jgi:very-short-patch-repair endonuclease